MWRDHAAWIRDPRGVAARIRTKRQLHRLDLLSPFPAETYRRLLAAIPAQGACFAPFDAPQPRAAQRCAVIVRHDIDTPACVTNAHFLLDIDAELGVPAAVFLRADDMEYPLATARHVAERCTALGLSLGLHSSCYRDADAPEDRLRDEIAHFQTTLGRDPDLLTMHGLGDHNLDVRRRIVSRIRRDLGRYGFRFTDATPVLRRYVHVFQDCNWWTDDGRRVLGNDFASAGDFLGRGFALILTHPGYWDPPGRAGHDERPRPS